MRYLILTILTTFGFGHSANALDYGEADTRAVEYRVVKKIEAILKKDGVSQAASSSADSGFDSFCQNVSTCQSTNWRPGSTSQGRNYQKRDFELSYVRQRSSAGNCRIMVTAYTGRFKALHGGAFCGIPVPVLHMFTDPFYCPTFSPEDGGTRTVEWPQDVQWENQPFLNVSKVCN